MIVASRSLLFLAGSMTSWVFYAKMEQNRKNATTYARRVYQMRQMVSALTVKLPVVSQHGNAKSSVWQYFGKLHHDYMLMTFSSTGAVCHPATTCPSYASSHNCIWEWRLPAFLSNACFPLLRLSQMANALVWNPTNWSRYCLCMR